MDQRSSANPGGGRGRFPATPPHLPANTTIHRAKSGPRQVPDGGERLGRGSGPDHRQREEPITIRDRARRTARKPRPRTRRVSSVRAALAASPSACKRPAHARTSMQRGLGSPWGGAEPPGCKHASIPERCVAVGFAARRGRKLPPRPAPTSDPESTRRVTSGRAPPPPVPMPAPARQR